MKYDFLAPLGSSVSILVLIAQKLAPCVAAHKIFVPGGNSVYNEY